MNAIYLLFLSGFYLLDYYVFLLLGNLKYSWTTMRKVPIHTILNSFNVAAVNYIALGIYQIVFATPMPNVNYATFCTATMTGSGVFNSAVGLEPAAPQTVNDVTVTTKRSDASFQDEPVVNVMVMQ